MVFIADSSNPYRDLSHCSRNDYLRFSAPPPFEEHDFRTMREDVPHQLPSYSKDVPRDSCNARLHYQPALPHVVPEPYDLAPQTDPHPLGFSAQPCDHDFKSHPAPSRCCGCCKSSTSTLRPLIREDGSPWLGSSPLQPAPAYGNAHPNGSVKARDETVSRDRRPLANQPSRPWQPALPSISHSLSNFASHAESKTSDAPCLPPLFTPRGMLHASRVLVQNTLPHQLYHHILLRIPSWYHSRLIQVIEDAKISKQDIDFILHPSHGDLQEVLWAVPEASLVGIKESWEEFVDSLMNEWKMQTIVSVVLLSAVLNLLQLDGVASDVVSRTLAIATAVSALMSLCYGCLYTSGFNTMRSPFNAAEWIEEVYCEKSATLWNQWVLLAMPAVWLSWSGILLAACIFSYVWRTGTGITPSEPLQHLSPAGTLGAQIAISFVFAMGLIYFIATLKTLAVRARSKHRQHLSCAREKPARPSSPRFDVVGACTCQCHNSASPSPTTGNDVIVREAQVQQPGDASGVPADYEKPTAPTPSSVHFSPDEGLARKPIIIVPDEPPFVPGPYRQHIISASPESFKRTYTPPEKWLDDHARARIIRIATIGELADDDTPAYPDVLEGEERGISCDDWECFLEELRAIHSGPWLVNIGVPFHDIDFCPIMGMVLYDCVETWNSQFFKSRGVALQLVSDSDIPATSLDTVQDLALFLTVYHTDEVGKDLPERPERPEPEESSIDTLTLHTLIPDVTTVPGPYTMHVMQLPILPSHFTRQAESISEVVWSSTRFYKIQRLKLAMLTTSTSRFLPLLKERDICFSEWAHFTTDIDNVLRDNIPRITGCTNSASLRCLTLFDLVNTWNELFFMPKGINFEIIKRTDDDDELLMTMYDKNRSTDSLDTSDSLPSVESISVALGPYEFTIKRAPELLTLPEDVLDRPPDVTVPWPLQRMEVLNHANIEDRKLPNMLRRFDITLEDWHAFTEHASKALKDELPILNVSDTLPIRETIINDVIEFWNVNFFNKRRLEVVFDEADDEFSDECHDDMEQATERTLYIQLRNSASCSTISLSDTASERSFGPAIRRSIPPGKCGEYAPFPIDGLDKLMIEHDEGFGFSGREENSLYDAIHDIFTAGTPTHVNPPSLITSMTITTSSPIGATQVPRSFPGSPITPPPPPGEDEWNV